MTIFKNILNRLHMNLSNGFYNNNNNNKNIYSDKVYIYTKSKCYL